MGPATGIFRIPRWESLIRLTTITIMHKRRPNEAGSKVYLQDKPNYCVTRMLAVEDALIVSQ